MTVEIVEFVMGDQRTSQSSVYSLPIDLRYRPGRYGWDTDSPKYIFDGGVRDADDASFVIDLPNGKYQLGCKFQSDGIRAHRISLYGNDQRLGLPFTVPVTTTVVEKVWPIEVANGRLTLVIHSLDRGENAYWVWSGLTLKRIGE